MWWIICVAVVVILYFFIKIKIRNEDITDSTKTFVILGNESNEMDFPIERKINVILSNESNEIDVSKDLRNESNEIDVSKDLSISPSCNLQINGKEKIDFDIINNKNKNKEIINYFRKTDRFKNKETINYFRKTDRFRRKKEDYRLRQKFEEVKMDIAAMVSRRNRDIKLKTKNMPTTKPIGL